MPVSTVTQTEKLDAIRIIDGMAELLAVPERWTQGWGARDANGEKCLWFQEIATCWCVSTAFGKACAGFSDNSIAIAWKAIEQAADVIVSAWNDDPTRTHADILALLREVRRNLEGDGGV